MFPCLDWDEVIQHSCFPVWIGMGLYSTRVSLFGLGWGYTALVFPCLDCDEVIQHSCFPVWIGMGLYSTRVSLFGL